MQHEDTFVNREREVAFFRRVLAAKRAEMVLLYGRRRVGKTSLLRHVAEGADIPVLYHVAAQTTRADELGRLSVRLAEFFNDDLLRAQPLRTWESVWIYLGQKSAKPFGFMLDEFPYAVEGDAALPSLLQHEWDRHLSKSNLKLILCGSSISMMERLGLSESSPLYGRRTGQWRLMPFDPLDFGLLWPARNLADLLAVYCVTGGNPHYIARFDPDAPLMDNIRDQVLSKGCMLYDEVPFLLREEVRNPRVYQAILAACAGGARKFSELSSKTGLDKAHLTRYIAILTDLGLIEREVPVTEPRPEKSRKGYYRVSDPFVAFWYRFVFPHRDRLELGEVDIVMRQAVCPALEAYLSKVVEPHAGSLFRTRWRHRLPFEPAFMGRFWDNQREIDWLILDQERMRALAVEIKWTASPVDARALAAQLRAKVDATPTLKGVKTDLALVSRAGFKRDTEVRDCMLIALTDEPCTMPDTDEVAQNRLRPNGD